MASTSPTNQPQSQPRPRPIPIKTAARKLPVKRKTPDLLLTPKPEPKTLDLLPDDDDLKPPPFKFHRIWTEPDEIRFLRGLLDCSAHGFTFPRDLHIFYDRFSHSMQQPYTKSQLSEKLRRLRKKFRVISARLSRGLDPSLLTPHDRALLDLSKQLWHPSFSSSSPFTNHNKKKTPRVGVSVTFSPPTQPLPSPPPPPPPPQTVANDAPETVANDDDNDDLDDEVNVDSDTGHHEEPPLQSSGGLGRNAGRTVMDVFDKSLKDVRMVLVRRGLLYPDQVPQSSPSNQGQGSDLMKRWRQQRVAELDVLARRLRLVLEHAIRE